MNSEPTSAGLDPPRAHTNRVAPVIECAALPAIELEGPGHHIRFANSAFCALVQRPREELVGKPFAEIVSNGPACVQWLDRAYQMERSGRPALPGNPEPGAPIWVQAMWPAREAADPPVRVIVQLSTSADFARKTTAVNEALLIAGLRQHELRESAENSNARLELEVAERLKVEKALLLAKAELRVHAEHLELVVAERTAELRGAMGDLEAFSYSLVHDLRAPLRAIRSFTQIALEMSREEVGPAAAESLRRVVKAAGRMDSLIQDVLSLSQVIRQPIAVTSVDVDALVRALVEERPELSLPRAEVTVDAPLLSMLGHEATLSQCLTNLLGNAVKFVEPGVIPRVHVWTEVVVPLPPASAVPEKTGPSPAPSPIVRLWVEDQGIGIDPKSHEVIFEIFQRLHGNLKYEGTGIGLAIVRKAIERMGGRVGVKSNAGKGSRFWLELPKG